MKLYLVSNNLVLEDIFYETDENVLEKRITRPLSLEGEKEAITLCKKIDADVVYSSNYASALATAKYYAHSKNLTININSGLNDAKIGEMGSRNIKMLRFMQERDFDFKFNHGESLNDVNNRMSLAVSKIIKKNMDKNIVIFTHKRAIMGYLLPFLDKGFNLDDRLILTYNDKVILDDVDTNYDLIEIDLDKGNIIDVKVI